MPYPTEGGPIFWGTSIPPFSNNPLLNARKESICTQSCPNTPKLKPTKENVSTDLFTSSSTRTAGPAPQHTHTPGNCPAPPHPTPSSPFLTTVPPAHQQDNLNHYVLMPGTKRAGGTAPHSPGHTPSLGSGCRRPFSELCPLSRGMGRGQLSGSPGLPG